MCMCAILDQPKVPVVKLPHVPGPLSSKTSSSLAPCSGGQQYTCPADASSICRHSAHTVEQIDLQPQDFTVPVPGKAPMAAKNHLGYLSPQKNPTTVIANQAPSSSTANAAFTRSHRLTSDCENLRNEHCVAQKNLPLCGTASPRQKTPSRPGAVSHVEPITLLKANQSTVSPVTTGISTVVSKAYRAHGGQPYHSRSFSRVVIPPAGSNSDGLAVCLQPHSSSSISPVPVSVPANNTPRDACTSTTSFPSSRPRDNSAERTPTLQTLHSPSLFKTPSSVDWYKSKTSRSSGNKSSCGSSSGVYSPQVAAKVTPPLCQCGKRTKRKIASSPGPNEGRAFFACPKSRIAGCNFFRWESLLLSSHGSESSPDLFSPELISSEYD